MTHYDLAITELWSLELVVYTWLDGLHSLICECELQSQMLRALVTSNNEMSWRANEDIISENTM